MKCMATGQSLCVITASDIFSFLFNPSVFHPDITVMVDWT